MTKTRYCPSCHSDREFEQPPCLDGHDECPEWACVACGHAVFAGWYADTQPAAAAPAARRGRVRAA